MKLKAKRVIFKHFIPQLNSAMAEYFFFVYARYLNNTNYECSTTNAHENRRSWKKFVYHIKQRTKNKKAMKRRCSYYYHVQFTMIYWKFKSSRGWGHPTYHPLTYSYSQLFLFLQAIIGSQPNWALTKKGINYLV